MYRSLHRPNINLTAVLRRPEIDPTSASHRPHIGPNKTLIGPSSAWYRPHIDLTCPKSKMVITTCVRSGNDTTGVGIDYKTSPSVYALHINWRGIVLFVESQTYSILLFSRKKTVAKRDKIWLEQNTWCNSRKSIPYLRNTHRYDEKGVERYRKRAAFNKRYSKLHCQETILIHVGCFIDNWALSSHSP